MNTCGNIELPHFCHGVALRTSVQFEMLAACTNKKNSFYSVKRGHTPKATIGRDHSQIQIVQICSFLSFLRFGKRENAVRISILVAGEAKLASASLFGSAIYSFI